ncbi:20813_t:CDS:1, partial [Racocetra persica]
EIPEYVNLKEKDTCTVCQDIISPTLQELITILTCWHFFHKKCINYWVVDLKLFCSNCRNEENTKNKTVENLINTEINIDNDENFGTITIIPTTLTMPMVFISNTLTTPIISIMPIASTASTIPTIPIPLALTTSLVSATFMIPAISFFTEPTSTESIYVEPTYAESIYNESTYTESIISVASTSLVLTVIRKDKNFQEIFKQLKTPVNNISEVISSSEDTSIVEKNNTTSSLVLLYNKANRNKKHTIYANQAEILS